MRLVLPALVLAFLLAAVTTPATPQAIDTVRRDIQAIYDRASAAALAARTYADAEAIHRWLDTPDCLYADFGGTPQNWAQMRSEVELSLETRLTSFSNVIKKIDVQGATATATTQVEGAARIVDETGQIGPKGAEHDVVTRATVRDVWVKTADGWRRKSHEKITPNGIASIDGKPPVTPGKQ